MSIFGFVFLFQFKRFFRLQDSLFRLSALDCKERKAEETIHIVCFPLRHPFCFALLFSFPACERLLIGFSLFFHISQYIGYR